MELLRRHPAAFAVATSVALGALYLLWAPPTLDLSAQVFRADLWSSDGWVIWNDSWYSGHTVPGYSLLAPPLSAWLGPELLGVVCAVSAAWIFAALAGRAYGDRAWLGTVWFGLASTVAVYGGRITFALGVTIGLAALLALQRRRLTPAMIAGLASGFASPVAGLFTALAAAAVLLGTSDRQLRIIAFATAATAMAGTLLLAFAFPVSGYQPFSFTAWLWIPAVCIGALLLLPREEVILRRGALLYLLLGLLSIIVLTPLGSNAVRLGTTFAGPILALVLIGRRPVVLALIAAPLLWWQWTATVRDVASGVGDDSARASYYEPLVEELGDRAGDRPVRVEVVPTRDRWESVYVGETYPLAHGWLRQLEAYDLDDFDAGPLDAAFYRDWLRRHGVSFVALPDADLDYGSVTEARLLERDPPYLRRVWSNSNWVLWEVLPPGKQRFVPGQSLATGGAQVSELQPDRFSVWVPGPGEYAIRMRYTPYFEVTAGQACLERDGDVSTQLVTEADRPQSIEVDTRISLEGLRGVDRTCSG